MSVGEFSIDIIIFMKRNTVIRGDVSFINIRIKVPHSAIYHIVTMSQAR